MNIALIIAGGKGERMKSVTPKQFLVIEGKPVIIHTLEKFQNHPRIDVIAVVCIKGWDDDLKDYARQFGITKLKHVIRGGNVGQESIKNGIMAMADNYDGDAVVLIHDAIRPNLSTKIISDCISSIEQHGLSVVVLPCNEAMLETSDGISSSRAYPRSQLRRTQTPQGARLSQLVELHKKAAEKGIDNSIATCTLATEVGESVWFVEGSFKNVKITTPEDIDIFRALLEVKDQV